MSNKDLENGYTTCEVDKEPGREERPTNWNKGLYPGMAFDPDEKENLADKGFVPRNNTQDRL